MPRYDSLATQAAAASRHVETAKSAKAARAHAAGAVTWTIDVDQPAVLRVHNSAEASRRYALVGLLLLTTALWVYNIATLIGSAS